MLTYSQQFGSLGKFNGILAPAAGFWALGTKSFWDEVAALPLCRGIVERGPEKVERGR